MLLPLQHPHRPRPSRTRYFHTIYDGEGKRVKKVTLTETTIYVFSGGKLVAEYTNTTPPQNPTVSYTATDLLGSPRVLTDSQGAVVSRRDFLPFGEEVYADGSNRTTANKYTTTGDDGLRKRFTGYEKDQETQLDFAEARMYENRYGRFTAVDPLLASGKSANPHTFNRYAYVMNSPLLFNDPDGLQAAMPITPGGKWYRPTDHVGSPVFRSTQPDKYEEITTRNKQGYLVYTPVGVEEALWEGSGLAEFQVRLNEQGPMKAVRSVDVRTGESLPPQKLTDFDRNGFEWIKGPGFSFLNPSTGAVQNAFEPHDVAFALTPFKFSVGGRGASVTAGGTETTALTNFYPSNNGFLNEPTRQFLLAGDKIDRFGGSSFSRFFSPSGTPKFARALPPGTENQPLRTFQVLKPFEVESGTVAPAFGNLGLGTQYRTPVTLETLLKRRIIEEIER